MVSEIIIVDEKDNLIGFNKRNSLKKKDIYRVSALWLINSKEDILLAKRHRNKLHHPRKWGPAVAGTVEKGETYKLNIIKEAEEELGIKNIKPKLGPKTRTQNEYNYFTQWFILILDKNTDDFKIQREEVEEVKWFSKEELLKELNKNPNEFLPNMKKYLNLFI